MTPLELTALGLVAAWLAVLSLIVLAFVRQLTIVQLRLEAGYRPAALEGPEIGSDLPEAIAVSLPHTNGGGPAYLVFLSPTCAPCVDIASRLSDHAFTSPILALFAGDDRMASDFASLLPPSVVAIRDPVAANTAEALGVNVTPFALQVENGIVTGKAHLRAVDDLVRLIDAYAVSDAADLAIRGRRNGD